MSDDPQNKPSSKLPLLLCLLLACLAVGGGGYWYLYMRGQAEAPAKAPADRQTARTAGQTSGQNMEPVARQSMEQSSASSVGQKSGQPETQSPASAQANATGQGLSPGTAAAPALPEISAGQTGQPEPGKESSGLATGGNQTSPAGEKQPEEAVQALPRQSNGTVQETVAGGDSGQSTKEADGGGGAVKDGDNQEETPVIVYGRGKARTPGGHVVQGEAPDTGAFVDTKRIYREGRQGAEDSIVSQAFVDGLVLAI